ncbi:conjugative transfer relaxase/helicase TraI [Vibrio sp. 10N.261.46.E12]|nr:MULTISPECIES: conjugative transfer relaxase/helicase TraI [unclassified Vibrio]OMO35713.1 conjugative transfer relaxase/helicase TraI [Vibrio sp. 10N.261.45.E1]PMJ22873.1 conjugative transfer relaxase/helicase TraI [Vibrio sp. 10N.286.45.B6]PML87226.1 conjugative transfer relaxase/helicase TraI [Vibrio sp. 10N.261.49.E11]PMM67515.1 conjugative transfer relaxase/helicase TraI [Vibrio sp. 10N.261.46.F12]PMM86725.1 conjugative transfer relaxase/helicase TraI [Vibrio sp. 10N.261.46.E8]
MMSISPIKSAKDAAAYYLNEEKEKNIDEGVQVEHHPTQSNDNYYLKEAGAQDNTFWWGKLAESAGLAGKSVDQETLESVLSGTLNGETVKGRRENHKAGFDLTFSAPKSVSILALVGGDTRLIDAHNNAVKYALSELEKDVAQILSIDKKGIRTYTNTESLLFGVVQHKTSRANDMQLHSHAITANLTRDQDNALRTLGSCSKQKDGVINGTGERIYHFQKYYTALYQSHLATNTQDLDFQTKGVGNNQFEIKGVPEQLIHLFSTRKHQIDEKAQEWGTQSQAAKDAAALDTRQDKQYQSESSLTTQWREATIEEGFDPDKLVENALKTSSVHQQSPSVIAKEALTRAVSHLGQTSTALRLETLIEKASSEFSKGGIQANAIELKALAEQWIKDEKLIPLPQKGLYTSQEMIQTEKQLMTVTKGNVHHMRTDIKTSVLQKLDAPTAQQKKLTDIYQSTKQFQVVNVFGNSEQITKNLLNLGSHSGKRVHLVSQNSKEQHDAQKHTRREAYTVAAWVKQLFTEERRTTVQGLLHNGPHMTNRDVLIVDNANKMNAKELIALTELAKSNHTKVVFLNSTSKRQGYKANNAIALYSKGDVASHNYTNAKEHDNIVRVHETDQTKLVNAYVSSPEKNSTQVLTTSTREQVSLTKAIRQQLQNEGQLARSGVTIAVQKPVFLSQPQKELVQHYQTGMILKHWVDRKPQELVIQSLDQEKNTLTVLNKDGQVIELEPASKAFQAMKVQIFKNETLSIHQGERIKTTGKHYESGLDAHQHVQVSEIKSNALTLVDDEGNKQSVRLDKLHQAPIAYDYVNTSHHIADKAHTLIASKSFALSKELLNELSAKSQFIDVYTDDADKAQKSLDKSDIKPSATQRVLHTSVNDHQLSNLSEALIKKDVQLAIHALSQEQNATVQEKAVSFALNHLSEREAAFTQKELVIEAVRYSLEEANAPITKTQIEDTLTQNKDILSASYSDGTRWTTQAALKTEKDILANIEEGKGKRRAFATNKQVERYLDTQSRTTQGQRDSITLISTTKDAFVAVQGLAGTGKSTMLESNIELIHSASEVGKNKPGNIVGLAPTHAAVSELKEKGVEAQTLESLLTGLRSKQTQPSDYDNTLFFLDESSMVSNRQAKEFTDLVIKSQSKAVLLGDKEQLLSLSAGKPFELAMKQGVLDTAYMLDIVRQKNEPLKTGVHNILDKQPRSSLSQLEKQAPDTQGQTQHVISTLDEDSKDKIAAQQQATEKLPYAVAQDFLSRTPETRDNTLVIAYTNLERDDITQYIREGLIEKKELGKENISAPRLRSVNASREELGTMMPYKEGLLISTKHGEYSQIVKVDAENNIVTLQSLENQKERGFFPQDRDNTFTTLFSLDQKPLSSGDKIVTRLTDKSKGIKANTEYQVTSATPELITAQSKDGKHFQIDPNKMQDSHWDYGYTRTADMAQGATYENVITAIKGKGALTNLRRAYIDLSRASHHIRLYTDNPNRMMKSWLSNLSTKESAIETLAQTPIKPTTYFNDKALPQEDVRYQDLNGDFDYKRFQNHINKKLPEYTESLAIQLLGQPNLTKSNIDYLTFGDGKTATKVSLTGEYRGYFKNYTTGEKGSLINLLMAQKNLSYKDAMTHAHDLLNAPEKHDLVATSNHDSLLNSTPKHIAQFEQRAKEYHAQGRSIKGTLAEQYLSNLGVSNIESNHVKYHPRVYSSEDKCFHPALITNIHNKYNETKAIEVTYLDGHSNKDDGLKVNPRVLGTKSKNMTLFNSGENSQITIISTSIENSFVIRDNTQSQFDIINVNHKNDIQNIPEDTIKQKVIISLSKDNTHLTPDNVEKITNSLADREIIYVSDNDIEQTINTLQKEMKKDHPEQEIKVDNTYDLKDEVNDIKKQLQQEKESRDLDLIDAKQFELSSDRSIEDNEYRELENKVIDREIERERER